MSVSQAGELNIISRLIKRFDRQLPGEAWLWAPHVRVRPASEWKARLRVSGRRFSAQVTEMDLLKKYFPGWLQGWQVLHCRASGPIPIPGPGPGPGLSPIVGWGLWVCCELVSSEYFLLRGGPVRLILWCHMWPCPEEWASGEKWGRSRLLSSLILIRCYFVKERPDKRRWSPKCHDAPGVPTGLSPWQLCPNSTIGGCIHKVPEGKQT